MPSLLSVPLSLWLTLSLSRDQAQTKGQLTELCRLPVSDGQFMKIVCVAASCNVLRVQMNRIAHERTMKVAKWTMGPHSGPLLGHRVRMQLGRARDNSQALPPAIVRRPPKITLINWHMTRADGSAAWPIRLVNCPPKRAPSKSKSEKPMKMKNCHCNCNCKWCPGLGCTPRTPRAS